jgi:hypothetical protein
MSAPASYTTIHISAASLRSESLVSRASRSNRSFEGPLIGGKALACLCDEPLDH